MTVECELQNSEKVGCEGKNYTSNLYEAFGSYEFVFLINDIKVCATK